VRANTVSEPLQNRLNWMPEEVHRKTDVDTEQSSAVVSSAKIKAVDMLAVTTFVLFVQKVRNC